MSDLNKRLRGWARDQDLKAAAGLIEALLDDNDRLRIALTDAESYLGKGLDKMASNILRVALGENS
jgi:hypothetical protein